MKSFNRFLIIMSFFLIACNAVFQIQATSTPAITRNTINEKATHTPVLDSTDTILLEEFNSPEGFSFTDPDIFIEDGKVFWTVYRDGGEQYVYRDIQAFSGDFKLTVIGQINSASNNCMVKAGVGDEPGNGLEILFSWFGGGCPVQGFNIRTGGAQLDIPPHLCTRNWGEEQWPWILGNTEYLAEITIKGNDANLFISGIGDFQGTLTYEGVFDTLYVGLTGGGDWPHCSGEIESIEVSQ